MKSLLTTLAALMIANSLIGCASSTQPAAKPLPPGSGGRGETPGMKANTDTAHKAN